MEPTSSPPTRRAVETLQALASGPQSHTEIARRVGMSPATTHAVLSELVACGWAVRDPASRHYRIGVDLLRWAASLAQPETLIQQTVGALASALGLPVLFGQLHRTHPHGPTLVVGDPSTFLTTTRYQATRSIELPFAAPFGSVIAAHASTEIRAAWLPQDPGLAARFESKLAEIAGSGFSVESYGPHVVQLLSLLRTSEPDFGRERTAMLTDDIQALIARGDLDPHDRYPALVSVPVEMGADAPGSLTVQLRRITDSPVDVLPLLRAAAGELQRSLAH